jgi:serine/threonine-protein kinase
VGGKYCVERTLGEGGIGIVVRARHLELRQPVAIKALLLRDDEEQVARFMREARASVQLRGEHVAKVTDVGRLDDGTPFMVMEYLDGEDLGALCERQRVPLADAIGFVLQACEGIAEAHALGIIHRDIKPRNLFLTRNERGRPLVKVLDFGLAKTFGNAGKDSHVTGVLTIAGSPPYMSPEQVRALRDVDVRADVWSLGVCLYELLSGETPFDAPTIPEVCARILMDKPTPIEQWVNDVPEEVRDALARCFAKERDQRFVDLAELATALEPYASADARGAADRIREALSAAPTPQPSADDVQDPSDPSNPEAPTLVRPHSETRTAFQTAHERRPKLFPTAGGLKGPYWVLALGLVSTGVLVFSATGVAFRFAQSGSTRFGAVSPVHPPAMATVTSASRAPDVGGGGVTTPAAAPTSPETAAGSLEAKDTTDDGTASAQALVGPETGSARAAKSVAVNGPPAGGPGTGGNDTVGGGSNSNANANGGHPNANGAALRGTGAPPSVEPATNTTHRPARPRPAHPESQRM